MSEKLVQSTDVCLKNIQFRKLKTNVHFSEGRLLDFNKLYGNFKPKLCYHPLQLLEDAKHVAHNSHETFQFNLTSLIRKNKWPRKGAIQLCLFYMRLFQEKEVCHKSTCIKVNVTIILIKNEVYLLCNYFSLYCIFTCVLF